MLDMYVPHFYVPPYTTLRCLTVECDLLLIQKYNSLLDMPVEQRC